jgi:transcription termination/antitermination protein NusG
MSKPMGLRMAEPRSGLERADGQKTFFPSENDCGQAWYGIQVAPRHERQVAAALEEKRLTTFLPLVTELHCWSDRKRRVEVPLFAGYTFVRLSAATGERVAVLRTRGVVRLVGREYVGTPIPTKEVEDVWTLVNSRLMIDPYPFLAVNDRVRIRSGSLAGVEGTLVRKNDGTALVVSVNLLNRSLVVRIDGFDIERIGGATAVRTDFRMAA